MVSVVHAKSDNQTIEEILEINETNIKHSSSKSRKTNEQLENEAKGTVTTPENEAKGTVTTPENDESNTEISTGREASKWGYDMYPERRGEKYKPGLFRTIFMFQGRERSVRRKCEMQVYEAVQKSPMVKLMMGALRGSGCEIDIRRHICCEVCDRSVSGGYDPELNQIVVCQNTAYDQGIVQGVLTHEMIHMFDYCRNNLDFKNLEHLACTEIRAANLTHCSFMSAWLNNDVSFFNIRKQHQVCVKNKALASVLSVRPVSEKEAMLAIDKVFPFCYNDLEPIGRRIRRSSMDGYKAYLEAKYYGYDV